MNRTEEKEILKALAESLGVVPLTKAQARESRKRFNAFKKTEEYAEAVARANNAEKK